jgi:uncharacterized damage-inducible protein DinB
MLKAHHQTRGHLMQAESLSIGKPEPNEYAPYYARYISLVEGDDILTALKQQAPKTVALLSGCKHADEDFRYAAGKWSVKDVLGHVVDTERIMAYRALRIARNDKTPIEGYEQDDYVKYAPFGQCKLAALLEEFITVRRATVPLFQNLDEAAWTRRGVANKNEVSARALAYIIAGHELHHRRILKEKYLSSIVS